MNRDNLEGLAWSVVVLAMMSLGASHGAGLARADRVEAQIEAPSGRGTAGANPSPAARAHSQPVDSAGGSTDWTEQMWAMP